MESELFQMIERAPALALYYGTRIVAALAIYFVGKFVAARVAQLLKRAMTARGVDLTVGGFVRNLVYYALFTVVIVAALGQLGVQTTSFVAIIGAAGLAIGLALQGSLANFAAGVLLILFRPFKAGDYIEAAGTAGIVRDISIFSTTLTTADNKKVVVANGKIYEGIIVNYSSEPERRVDLVVSVSYQADTDLVRSTLQDIVAAEPRILTEKGITLALDALADSSVNWVLRVWVKSPDAFTVRTALLERIKREFDQRGIEIPFPQRVVHLPPELKLPAPPTAVVS